MFLMEVRDRAFHVSWWAVYFEPELTIQPGIVEEIGRCHTSAALNEDRKVTL